ncbi:MAG: hypothetical protein H7831_17270 [Magnetococcus sp. WYHC-3]
MKRTTFLALAGMVSLGLSACGGSDSTTATVALTGNGSASDGPLAYQNGTTIKSVGDNGSQYSCSDSSCWNGVGKLKIEFASMPANFSASPARPIFIEVNGANDTVFNHTQEMPVSGVINPPVNNSTTFTVNINPLTTLIAKAAQKAIEQGQDPVAAVVSAKSNVASAFGVNDAALDILNGDTSTANGTALTNMMLAAETVGEAVRRAANTTATVMGGNATAGSAMSTILDVLAADLVSDSTLGNNVTAANNTVQTALLSVAQQAVAVRTEMANGTYVPKSTQPNVTAVGGTNALQAYSAVGGTNNTAALSSLSNTTMANTTSTALANMTQVVNMAPPASVDLTNTTQRATAVTNATVAVGNVVAERSFTIDSGADVRVYDAGMPVTTNNTFADGTLTLRNGVLSATNVAAAQAGNATKAPSVQLDLVTPPANNGTGHVTVKLLDGDNLTRESGERMITMNVPVAWTVSNGNLSTFSVPVFTSTNGANLAWTMGNGTNGSASLTNTVANTLVGTAPSVSVATLGINLSAALSQVSSLASISMLAGNYTMQVSFAGAQFAYKTGTDYAVMNEIRVPFRIQ